jgi:hypothetical protein
VRHHANISSCSNKAQLRELERIRTQLLGSRKPLALPSSINNDGRKQKSRPTLKTFLTMARFIARAKLSARAWAKQETVRQRLVTAVEEQRRSKKARQFKVVRTNDEQVAF